MENRSILFMPDADTEALAGGTGLAATSVDIAVAGDGEVYKDRHGDAAAVLTRLRAALATKDLSEEPEVEVLGVPLGEIAGLTLDGAHWLEVFGSIHASSPFGGPVLRFRIAQAPGGKKSGSRFGVSQGDSIAVKAAAVVGVQRKGGEPVGPVRISRVGGD